MMNIHDYLSGVCREDKRRTGLLFNRPQTGQPMMKKPLDRNDDKAFMIGSTFLKKKIV